MEQAEQIQQQNMDILFQLSRFYLKSDMLVHYIDVLNKMIQINQDQKKTKILKQQVQKANILFMFQGGQQKPKYYPPNVFSESEIKISGYYFWEIEAKEQVQNQNQNSSTNQHKQYNMQILRLQESAINYVEKDQKDKSKQCYQKIRQILNKQKVSFSDPLHIKNQALIKSINRKHQQSIIDYKQCISLGMEQQNLRYLLIKSYHLLQPHQKIVEEAQIYFQKYGDNSSFSLKVFQIVNDQWRHFDLYTLAMLSARKLKKQLSSTKYYLVDAKIAMSFDLWSEVYICWDKWKRSYSNVGQDLQYDNNYNWQLRTTQQYLSICNKALKNYEQVIKNCTQLINNHVLNKQKLFQYYDRRAYAYFYMKQYNKSLSDFEKCLQIRYVQYIIFMKAKCYIEMGNMKKAAQIYNYLISNLGDKTTQMSPEIWKEVKQYFKSKRFSD